MSVQKYYLWSYRSNIIPYIFLVSSFLSCVKVVISWNHRLTKSRIPPVSLAMAWEKLAINAWLVKVWKEFVINIQRCKAKKDDTAFIIFPWLFLFCYRFPFVQRAVPYRTIIYAYTSRIFYDFLENFKI